MVNNKLEVLKKEHELVTNHIHQLISSNDKFVSFGLTVVVTGFVVALTGESYLGIQIANILFGTLIIYGLYHYNYTFSNVGYLKKIEDEINSIIGEKILIRTDIWDNQLKKNLSLITLFILIVVIYLTMISLNINYLFDKFKTCYRYYFACGTIIFHGLLFISILISLLKVWKTYKNSYKLSQEIIENSKK